MDRVLPVMVRPSGDILQVFVEISPSLPLLNHLHTSMFIYVYVDFHWPYDVFFEIFSMERNVFPGGGNSNIFYFHPEPSLEKVIRWVSTNSIHFRYTNCRRWGVMGLFGLPLEFEACTAGSIRNRPVVNLDPTTLLIRQLRLLKMNPKIIWLLCDLQLASMTSDWDDDDDDDDDDDAGGKTGIGGDHWPPSVVYVCDQERSYKLLLYSVSWSQVVAKV